MRRQFHFHLTDSGLFIWDVDRLIELSCKFSILDIFVSEVREPDETFGFKDRDALPTCRRIAQHAKLVNEASLSHPSILSQSGQVMNEMHRVCKAFIQALESLIAVQFPANHKPDFMDVSSNDLPH